MSLRDLYIMEGAEDRENRELAELAAQTLIDNVKRVKEPHYTCRDEDDFVAVGWRGWELPSVPKQVVHLFESMRFLVSAVPPEKQDEQYDASFYHHSEGQRDAIVVFFKPKGMQVTEETWKRYVAVHGTRILESKFSSIVHEFIHAMDSKRLSDPTYMDRSRYDAKKLMQNDPAEIKRYFNDPIEFNAIFQQFASKVEKKMAGDMNMHDDQDITSPQEMVDYGMENMPKAWQRRLSPKMRRHLIKRLTQLYYDMKDKYMYYDMRGEY